MCRGRENVEQDARESVVEEGEPDQLDQDQVEPTEVVRLRASIVMEYDRPVPVGTDPDDVARVSAQYLDLLFRAGLTDENTTVDASVVPIPSVEQEGR